jgi:hypothetical protein
MPFGNLFNPNAKAAQDQEKVAIRRECERVRQLALAHIPAELQEGLHVNVSEVRLSRAPLNLTTPQFTPLRKFSAPCDKQRFIFVL